MRPILCFLDATVTRIDQSDMGHLRRHVYRVAQTLNPVECILALDGDVVAATLVVVQVADEVGGYTKYGALYGTFFIGVLNETVVYISPALRLNAESEYIFLMPLRKSNCKNGAVRLKLE